MALDDNRGPLAARVPLPLAAQHPTVSTQGGEHCQLWHVYEPFGAVTLRHCFHCGHSQFAAWRNMQRSVGLLYPGPGHAGSSAATGARVRDENTGRRIWRSEWKVFAVSADFGELHEVPPVVVPSFDRLADERHHSEVVRMYDICVG